MKSQNEAIKFIFVLIFFLTYFFIQVGFAFEYQFQCRDQKLLGFTSSTEKTEECQIFLAAGFKKCYDSSRRNSSESKITISTPNDQYYKSKQSDQYSRALVTEILSKAIEQGSDPYLYLAITILENPPIIEKPEAHPDPDVKIVSRADYESQYGQIPMDLPAVADIMECRKKLIPGEFGAHAYMNTGELKKFILDQNGEDHFLCLNSRLWPGAHPMLGIFDSAEQYRCCAKIKVDASRIAMAEPRSMIAKHNGVHSKTLTDQAGKQFLSQVASSYIKRRFAGAQRRSAIISNPAEKLAMIFQAYNGYGIIEANGELLGNNCFTWMDFSKMPVYGAGIAEIMMNSLMNNSEIKSIVDKLLVSTKKTAPVSYLCAVYGDGVHSISSYAFSDLLGKYLGDRIQCPKHTNRLKN